MKPIWPKVAAPFVRTMLASHSALGLFIAALCYLVCLSGTVAVFEAEFARWERPAATTHRPVSAAEVQHAAERTLHAAGGSVEQLSLILPSDDAPFLVASVEGANGAKQWSIGDDGALTETQVEVWRPFMVALHTSLNAPGLIGYFVVGLAGVAMLGLAISGLLAHSRIFRDAFTLRWGGAPRVQEADLHNRLSVWGLPFNVAVSTTGAYLGIVSIFLFAVAAINFNGDQERAIAPFAAPELAENAEPAPLIRLDAVFNEIARQNPHAHPYSLYLNHPGTAGQDLNLYAALDNRLRYGELYYAGNDGRVRHVGYGDGQLGQQLYGAVYPIHFGDFGGLPIKLIYGVLGLALTIVCASGVSIWLARRTDQNRPAPRAQRAWLATVWGAPIGLAASAVAVIGFSLDPLLAFWAAVAIVFVLSLVAPHALLARLLRLLTAATMLAAIAAELMRAGATQNTTALGVNAALAGLAIVLAASTVSFRTAPRGEPNTIAGAV